MNNVQTPIIIHDDIERYLEFVDAEVESIALYLYGTIITQYLNHMQDLPVQQRLGFPYRQELYDIINSIVECKILSLINLMGYNSPNITSEIASAYEQLVEYVASRQLDETEGYYAICDILTVGISEFVMDRFYSAHCIYSDIMPILDDVKSIIVIVSADGRYATKFEFIGGNYGYY